MVQEKDVEDQLDRSCEKWRRSTEGQVGEEHPTKSEWKEG